MNIKQRRQDKGWSQEDLARFSGLSTRTIQRIESGQTAGNESLKCLAAVFEITINELTQEPATTSIQTKAKPLLNKKEHQAIEYAKTLLAGPNASGKDLLSKTERKAINYAKKLLGGFKK